MDDYDQAVAFLGDWGLFQKMVFFLLCLSMIPNGLTMSIVFVTDTPPHHCFVPQVNLTQDWHLAIIPVKVSIAPWWFKNLCFTVFLVL